MATGERRLVREVGNPGVRTRGYTIAEVMITAAIIGLLFGALPPMLIQSYRSVVTTIARIEVQRDADDCLTVIKKLLPEAVPSSVRITSPAGEPPYSKIEFTTVSGKMVVIQQSGNKLLLSEGGGEGRTLTPHLGVGFFFASNTATIEELGVSLLLQKPTYEGGKVYAQQYDETITLKNKG